MIRAAVIGATGYTGAELVRILHSHPEVTLTVLTSRQYAGKRFSDAFPAFYGQVDLPVEAYDASRVGKNADVVFMALPHKMPMALVPELLGMGCRVIDLSADFRFSDAEAYEKAYEPHQAPEFLEKAVYGLCEIFREKIVNAELIGNPGCYPTCTLLPLAPLVREGLVENTIVVDAKSGVSGAGRGLSLGNMYCEVAQGFKAYKVGEHRHRPEIAATLDRMGLGNPCVTFVPHLVPTIRGMLATTYVRLREKWEEAAIREVIAAFYADAPFVRVLPEGRFPDLAFVRGTNLCDIGLKMDGETGTLILVSAIDNLVKGASGQAVQNMNIMWGLDETLGLRVLPPVV